MAEDFESEADVAGRESEHLKLVKQDACVSVRFLSMICVALLFVVSECEHI